MVTKTSGLRETLVTSALTMLESGDADLSLRAVARAAGVSAMAPYRHFPHKTALLVAIAERGFGDLAEKLAAADALADRRAALEAQGMAYVDFALARPALFRLMFASEFPLSLNDESGAFALLADRVASLRPTDREAATLACWAGVHGLAMLALDGRLPGLTVEARCRVIALVAAI